MFFCFTKFFFTYLLFFWRWSLWFLEKKDPFIHSLQHPGPLTYLLFGGGGVLVFVVSWKERPIHSFIATQKRKKKSKRTENVLISF
jgi:hypothetical protein